MAEITGPASAARSGSSDTLDVPPLELPEPGSLSDQQVRGRACVWCAVALSNATAYDLGVRDTDAHGSAARWFPRACLPCASTHLCAASEEHRKDCEQCATSLPWCTTGQRLFGAAMRIHRQRRQ
ncbi:hypothetical protein ACFWPU_15845 [Streptomyces sp. NPDC058471]|uniref:hypothetical protein n=1 Tax=Streptomyces sp. NPDC058471 TaxID=3346516 RepID=UPI0036499CCE